jgi:hypothetical protein
MNTVATFAFVGVMLAACNAEAPEKSDPLQRGGDWVEQPGEIPAQVVPPRPAPKLAIPPPTVDQRLQKLQGQIDWVEKRIGTK